MASQVTLLHLVRKVVVTEESDAACQVQPVHRLWRGRRRSGVLAQLRQALGATQVDSFKALNTNITL